MTHCLDNFLGTYTIICHKIGWNVRLGAVLLYQAMDIFLLPSLFEGIPLVGIEAQAAGLPCVFSGLKECCESRISVQ